MTVLQLTLTLAFCLVPSHSAEEPAMCPRDMVTVAGFCIDRYEAPNEAGANPLVAQTALDGEIWCTVHGKRLCTEAEWVQACAGKAKQLFPYGKVWKFGFCNDSRDWRKPSWKRLARYPAPEARQEIERLYQADPSGSNRKCVSDAGVYDLTGNASEWVRRSFEHRNNFPYVMKGCYWSGCYSGAQPSCAFVNPAHPGSFRSYEVGFRCCQTIH